ncbi:S8 family peptidase [Nocardioides sp. Soil805]|uniref:S8 family peptidase n=1 Tax=Nocardioides sp. Soil805 TaxID=1736416 RepID=UPI000702CA5D|nr:S8/S53 family peptidase [Nocardioides sp. Soil805]KRF34877.1 hypothetical protein ASG94_12020 [Nocardioides sp. Soil805]
MDSSTNAASDTGPDEGGGKPDPHAAEERERLQEAVLREQVAYLIKALGGPEYAAAVWSEDGRRVEYLYRPGFILARDEHWRDVADTVGAERLDDERSQRQRGLTVLRVTTDADTSVPDILARVDRELGLGKATPDHIMFVTGPGRLCPATEPEEPGTSPAPHPGITTDLGAGTDVFVSVVDTGWWPPAATDPASPWLAGVDGDPETIDLDHIHPYAGHGTFIAGVVRTQAPAAEVRVEGFLPTGGAAYESEMVVQLGEALAWSPDIISLSAGCPTRDELPLLSFEVFWEQRLRHQKGTVLVAAAGNDGHRRPFWPAAFPWTVSVGAIDADGARADFSNFGSWVDVYALGTDLVNAYPTGTFFCHEPPNAGDERTFTGIARWSGTSFSTPLVSGLIAARMSRHGISARKAADQLLAEAATAGRRGVGPTLYPAN